MSLYPTGNDVDTLLEACRNGHIRKGDKLLVNYKTPGNLTSQRRELFITVAK